ncbi:MAG: hypothetical protein NTV51_12835 [Verrucomicrobia bacterium]|nr:hypothetical protein [Verrucomicrobiota bacterium]
MKRAALFLFLLGGVQAASLIERHPQKSLISHALQELVDRQGKEAENHFFVVRRKDGKDWVYWREGRILWETDMRPYYEKKGAGELRARAIWSLRLSTPWRALDLDTDVVSELRDSDRWTNHILKSEAESLIHECTVDGELLTITRNKKPNQSPQPTTGLETGRG